MDLHDRLRGLIESGHYDEALALLGDFGSALPKSPPAPVHKSLFALEPDDGLIEVNEHEVTLQIARTMAGWGIELAGAVDAHVARVLARLRGRADEF